MASTLICPICNKRRAERYCPAKGEKICAIDCGTEREVTIDCPADCTYLIAARRWEQAHPRPLPEGEIPFPDVSIPAELIHTRGAALSGLGYTVLQQAREQSALSDADILEAVEALASTYRTLGSGLYYEKPPAGPVAARLYAALAKFIEEDNKRAAAQGHPALSTSEVFHLLVFFLRFGRLRSNGRPRTRAFLEFLRAQFPRQTELAEQQSRIVIP